MRTPEVEGVPLSVNKLNRESIKAEAPPCMTSLSWDTTPKIPSYPQEELELSTGEPPSMAPM
jgi:hypothetical protein